MPPQGWSESMPLPNVVKVDIRCSGIPHQFAPLSSSTCASIACPGRQYAECQMPRVVPFGMFGPSAELQTLTYR